MCVCVCTDHIYVCIKYVHVCVPIKHTNGRCCRVYNLFMVTLLHAWRICVTQQYKNTHNKNTDNKKRNIDLFKLRSAGHVRGDWSKERNMDQ